MEECAKRSRSSSVKGRELLNRVNKQRTTTKGAEPKLAQRCSYADGAARRMATGDMCSDA